MNKNITTEYIGGVDTDVGLNINLSINEHTIEELNFPPGLINVIDEFKKSSNKLPLINFLLEITGCRDVKIHIGDMPASMKWTNNYHISDILAEDGSLYDKSGTSSIVYHIPKDYMNIPTEELALITIDLIPKAVTPIVFFDKKTYSIISTIESMFRKNITIDKRVSLFTDLLLSLSGIPFIRNRLSENENVKLQDYLWNKYLKINTDDTKKEYMASILFNNKDLSHIYLNSKGFKLSDIIELQYPSLHMRTQVNSYILVVTHMLTVLLSNSDDVINKHIKLIDGIVADSLLKGNYEYIGILEFIRIYKNDRKYATTIMSDILTSVK